MNLDVAIERAVIATGCDRLRALCAGDQPTNEAYRQLAYALAWDLPAPTRSTIAAQIPAAEAPDGASNQLQAYAARHGPCCP